MKKYVFPLIFIVVAAIFALWAIPALAQEPAGTAEPTMDQVNQVARNLNCPTCKGLNLEDCRTQTCTQWRSQIKDLLAQGYTEQEVLDWFIARFGVEVLQEPPRQGNGLFAWLLPLLGFVAGVGWLAFLLRKWSAHKTPEPAATAPEDAIDVEYLKKIEQDLKEF